MRSKSISESRASCKSSISRTVALRGGSTISLCVQNQSGMLTRRMRTPSPTAARGGLRPAVQGCKDRGGGHGYIESLFPAIWGSGLYPGSWVFVLQLNVSGQIIISIRGHQEIHRCLRANHSSIGGQEIEQIIFSIGRQKVHKFSERIIVQSEDKRSINFPEQIIVQSEDKKSVNFPERIIVVSEDKRSINFSERIIVQSEDKRSINFPERIIVQSEDKRSINSPSA